MRFVRCGSCHNEKTSVSSSLLVDGIVYCENCLKEKFPSDADLKGKTIVKEFDPTVCANCSKDFGDVVLRLHGNYPVCDSCQQAIQARIFPSWVKAFFAGVLVLVVFSLAWNWRFIEAYYQLKQTEGALADGSVEEVAKLYSSIAANLPEVHEMGQVATYYKGLVLLKEDNGAEALQAFRSCTALPKDFGVPVLTLQAEIATAFDHKDYSGFVDASTRYLSFDSSSVAMAQVASAYACLYAVEQSDSAKSIALNYLDKAMSAHDTTRFFSTYVNRIEHRLATREIIDHKTFEARFPKGWTNK